MLLTTSQIKDIDGADIWVMDPNVRFVDDVKPISENELYRVRGVEGVGWAVRLYKGLTRARMPDRQIPAGDLDRLGRCHAGRCAAARQNRRSARSAICAAPTRSSSMKTAIELLWPGEPIELGRTFEMNDHLATVVGVFRARRTFQTNPVICARYSQATLFVPRQRKVLSFILGQPQSRLRFGRRLPADQGPNRARGADAGTSSAGPR